jgi:hypothetical protein
VAVSFRVICALSLINPTAAAEYQTGAYGGTQTEAGVDADNGDLAKGVARLLRRRPGWSFQVMPTPGAPPVWCFGSGGETDLSVTVDAGSICVYVVKTDHDVTLGSANELVAWRRAESSTSSRAASSSGGNRGGSTRPSLPLPHPSAGPAHARPGRGRGSVPAHHHRCDCLIGNDVASRWQPDHR